MLPSTLLTASHELRRQQESRSELAYRVLKDKIVTLELAPATLLSEAELMASLDMGRTPVREALQRLAHEDLVVILPRRGTVVTDLNPRDLRQIFEMRVELEAFAARLACERALDVQIAKLETLFDDIEDITERGDHHQLIVIDQQVHSLIAQAAHNTFLADTLQRHYTHVLRLWYVSLHKVTRLHEAIQEHCDIIEAVKTGDAERAAQVMRKHIISFQTEFEISSDLT